MVKKAKKRNVSNILQKKNHLLPKCQDLELEFSKESWSLVKKNSRLTLKAQL